ncbi:29 kDa ribonucleoprotein A, chloroplastic [Apostasia shenzhenica]|uniref:29 kDa ribonucleoprotein A, chloroplastic n=1 Tax=Apostasia shenzhenica TaxID=1088818 RepID=A0A2H9ZUL6_9ASPA|nr:29 kDa ribonucleoprotein A, chloroplastic [Apostasia shenzhenica]
MDFDEYEYLEKSVESPENRKEKGHRSSRNHSNGEKERGSEARESKRSRTGEKGEKDDREDRERSDRREKNKDHRMSSDGQRDREREHRSRDREHHDRDREKEKVRQREKDAERENEKDRSREREREREKEKRRDRDMERDREKGREKEGEKEREREREPDRWNDRERSRRSSSRSMRQNAEHDIEADRARSRERREREERDIRERESRRFRDKKDVEPEADPERDQRTVFAYQMPLKATERDVYEFFSKAGKVRDVRLIMDRISRRSKGVGYIEFYDAMSVPMAIALSGHQLLGQPVMVKPSEAEKNLVPSNTSSAALGVAGARKIYVGNLHFNITEDQLRQVFESFGPVELVQLPLDPETGHCRGYGFVQFSQVEHAKAAQSLNGKLDIAGRFIKVSAVTDHVGVQESGTNATDFDDDDGGGLSLNARSRALLMQKLDRTGVASSIAETLGVPGLNAISPVQTAVLLPTNGQAAVPAAYPSLLSNPLTEPIGQPSEYILLKNMFDPSTETDPDFDLDIKEEVQEECAKFGPLKHIHVDKFSSNGCVYLQFETVAAAANCQRAMHMRWFARRSLSATFMWQGLLENTQRVVTVTGSSAA